MDDIHLKRGVEREGGGNCFDSVVSVSVASGTTFLLVLSWVAVYPEQILHGRGATMCSLSVPSAMK